MHTISTVRVEIALGEPVPTAVRERASRISRCSSGCLPVRGSARGMPQLDEPSRYVDAGASVTVRAAMHQTNHRVVETNHPEGYGQRIMADRFEALLAE